MVQRVGQRMANIVCAHCKHPNVAFTDVEIFCRESEDSETGQHVFASEDGVVRIDSSMEDNPSTRRNGVIIHVECEACDVISQLQLANHKGSLLVEWVHVCEDGDRKPIAKKQDLESILFELMTEHRKGN